MLPVFEAISEAHYRNGPFGEGSVSRVESWMSMGFQQNAQGWIEEDRSDGSFREKSSTRKRAYVRECDVRDDELSGICMPEGGEEGEEVIAAMTIEKELEEINVLKSFKS